MPKGLPRFRRALLVVSLVALVIVPIAAALVFTDESFETPTGVVGSPYTHQFGGSGGCGPALPYQFKLLTGELPPGLALAKNGLVSGTPTQAGSWSFWVELSDEDPPSASWCRPAKSERQFTIDVVEGEPGRPPHDQYGDPRPPHDQYGDPQPPPPPPPSPPHDQYGGPASASTPPPASHHVARRHAGHLHE